MNRFCLFSLILISVTALVTSCSPPEPNFDLNNDNLMASAEEPADYMDSTKVKRMFVNDKIILTDISGAQNDVKKRFWDTNDDGEWDAEFQNKDFVEIAFEDEGFHKIVFCVNNEDNCITKWVYILPDIDIPTGPKIFVFEPNIETPKRSYDLEIATENIFSEEELSVTVDGEKVAFDFDPASNLLSAKITGLKRGEQTPVEIKANTTDGEIVEYLTITRQESGASPPPGPDVKILDVSRKVNVKNIRVKATTKNYSGEELLVTLNNRPVSDYRSSGGSGNWVINLDLREGSNTLIVSLPDKSKSAKAYITYEKEKPGGGGNNNSISSKNALPMVTYSGDKQFSAAKVEVIVQTEMVYQKNLSFSLDGQRVSFTKEKSYSGNNLNKTDWKLSLNLKKGTNRLSYSASNDNGTKQDDIILVYDGSPAEEREKPFNKTASVGISSNGRSDFPKNCIALYTQDKFNVVLLPNNKVELQSFKVYSNVCGGVKVTLDGDGDTQSFQAALNAGRSTIYFTPIDALLQPNLSYTLTLQPIKGYHSSCNASAAPRFEKVTDCNATSYNHNTFSIDQSRNPILYDLKIKYQ